ncbi:hypothetical protein CC117_05380 [Parafrankia colletiae]|uniref:Uncharacterized protein n=1 Tax=Parafrankia colletiae TaxID=573497 RepID=A0A1S1QG73_9ACTN|nr:hypothetical protein CC117_05380 [Parafrankia colletiae]
MTDDEDAADPASEVVRAENVEVVAVAVPASPPVVPAAANSGPVRDGLADVDAVAALGQMIAAIDETVAAIAATAAQGTAAAAAPRPVTSGPVEVPASPHDGDAGAGGQQGNGRVVDVVRTEAEAPAAAGPAAAEPEAGQPPAADGSAEDAGSPVTPAVRRTWWRRLFVRGNG